MTSFPIGHIVLIAIGWPSFFLFIAIFIIVMTERKSAAVLRSSYVYLFLSLTTAEAVLFLVVELLMRPRRYAWLPCFTEDMINYTFVVVTRISVGCGHLVCAFNRFSAVAFDASSYKKMWSNMIITLIFVACWWMGVCITLPATIIYQNDIKFVLLPTGNIQLFGGRFSEFESLFMAPFCFSIVILLFIFYSITAFKLKGAHKTHVEKRLFLCGFLSSIPLTMEIVRSGLGIASYFLEDSALFVLGGDIWFYEVELSFSFQVWLHAILLRPIRQKLLCRKLPWKGSTNDHQRSKETTLPVSKPTTKQDSQSTTFHEKARSSTHPVDGISSIVA